MEGYWAVSSEIGAELDSDVEIHGYVEACAFLELILDRFPGRRLPMWFADRQEDGSDWFRTSNIAP